MARPYLPREKGWAGYLWPGPKHQATYLLAEQALTSTAKSCGEKAAASPRRRERRRAVGRLPESEWLKRKLHARQFAGGVCAEQRDIAAESLGCGLLGPEPADRSSASQESTWLRRARRRHIHSGEDRGNIAGCYAADQQ